MKAVLAPGDARRKRSQRAVRSTNNLAGESNAMHDLPPHKLMHWIDDAANVTVAVTATLGLLAIIFG